VYDQRDADQREKEKVCVRLLTRASENACKNLCLSRPLICGGFLLTLYRMFDLVSLSLSLSLSVCHSLSRSGSFASSLVSNRHTCTHWLSHPLNH
jgi:hypothetical protein